MKAFKLKLRIKSSLLVGGYNSPGLFDLATARDPNGVPLIPASAIKGALRIEFEKIAKLDCENRICNMPDNPCGTENPCIVCSIFGSPGLEGKLRFHEAKISEDLQKLFSKREGSGYKPTGLGYATRYGVAISRKRRSAVENMLFNVETISQFID